MNQLSVPHLDFCDYAPPLPYRREIEVSFTSQRPWARWITAGSLQLRRYNDGEEGQMRIPLFVDGTRAFDEEGDGCYVLSVPLSYFELDFMTRDSTVSIRAYLDGDANFNEDVRIPHPSWRPEPTRGERETTYPYLPEHENDEQAAEVADFWMWAKGRQINIHVRTLDVEVKQWACVPGTRVPIAVVQDFRRAGYTAEEIAEELPSLTAQRVEAVFADLDDARCYDVRI